MHTIIVLSIGFGLLGLCALAGHLRGRSPGIATTALLFFLPLWLAGAGINMYTGVKQAGYSVADEAPICHIVFAVPAVAALIADAAPADGIT